MKHKAIIFDCDGVIFDSNKLKITAFREVLSAYPKHLVNDFIKYHKEHGGISSYVKSMRYKEYSSFEAISLATEGNIPD